MALYLVLMTTLGAIRGVHVKEFVEGETVDLDDDDLAGVGLRDGWLLPVSEADAPPVEPLTRYTVLLPDEMPIPRSGWEADRPAAGDVVELTDDEAAPLIALGAIQLTVDSGQLTAETGITETDQFPEDYTNYVALQEIQLDESGNLLMPGDKFGMSAEQAADWLEAGLIALDTPEAVAAEDTPPTPPQAGGNDSPATAPDGVVETEAPVKATRGRKAKGNQGGDSDGKA